MGAREFVKWGLICDQWREMQTHLQKLEEEVEQLRRGEVTTGRIICQVDTMSIQDLKHVQEHVKMALRKAHDPLSQSTPPRRNGTTTPTHNILPSSAENRKKSSTHSKQVKSSSSSSTRKLKKRVKKRKSQPSLTKPPRTGMEK